MDGDTLQADFNASLAAEELSTEVAGTILSWIKAQTKPWSIMSYDEQETLTNAITKQSLDLVTQVVHTIAADGRRVIVATVDKVTFVEKGVQATVLAKATSEFRHDLADSRGLDVLIVVADAGSYIGGEAIRPDAPKNNQPELPIDETPVFDNTAAAND